MEKQLHEKFLADLRWVPLDGEWEKDGSDGLVFAGGEYEPPPSAAKAEKPEIQEPEPQKYINFGTLLFNQNFEEGHLGMQVEFDDVDHRSSAAIIIQYNPATKDMLTFGISGGGLKYAPGVSGFLYRLMQWATPTDQRQQGTPAATTTPKTWTPLFQVGLGVNLKAKRAYALDVSVIGSVVTLFIDGVEIG